MSIVTMRHIDGTDATWDLLRELIALADRETNEDAEVRR